MSVVAFVSIEGFYTACLSRREPALASQAIAVMRKRRMLDASAAARKLGILPGIAASEARYAARAGAVKFIDYDESDYSTESKRWLDVCAGATTVIEPLEPHCAFLDLSGHPGARELATPIAADIYAAIRLCPRIGIAAGKLVARLATEAVPEGADAAYIAGLPIESLWQAKPDHLRRLRFLGYRTIGEVAALPAHLLQKHFGQEGIKISLLARGSDRTPVRALYPPDELAARFNFPQPARLDQEIESGLRFLSKRLGAVLCARDQQTSLIELAVLFGNGQSQNAQRRFTHAMQSPGALLTGLRLTLRRISITQEICSILARLPHVERTTRKQLALQNNTKDETAANILLTSLKNTFGNDSVKKATEIEVPRRQQILKAFSEGA